MTKTISRPNAVRRLAKARALVEDVNDRLSLEAWEEVQEAISDSLYFLEAAIHRLKPKEAKKMTNPYTHPSPVAMVPPTSDLDRLLAKVPLTQLRQAAAGIRRKLGFNVLPYWTSCGFVADVVREWEADDFLNALYRTHSNARLERCGFHDIHPEIWNSYTIEEKTHIRLLRLTAFANFLDAMADRAEGGVK